MIALSGAFTLHRCIVHPGICFPLILRKMDEKVSWSLQGHMHLSRLCVQAGGGRRCSS